MHFIQEQLISKIRFICYELLFFLPFRRTPEANNRGTVRVSMYIIYIYVCVCVYIYRRNRCVFVAIVSENDSVGYLILQSR